MAAGQAIILRVLKVPRESKVPGWDVTLAEIKALDPCVGGPTEGKALGKAPEEIMTIILPDKEAAPALIGRTALVLRGALEPVPIAAVA